MVVSEIGKHSHALTYFNDEGLTLHFQDGPIAEWGTNGTTNEAVIQVLIDRLTSLQEMDGRTYACKENARAITHLGQALDALEARTAARVARGVEGTSHV